MDIKEIIDFLQLKNNTKTADELNQEAEDYSNNNDICYKSSFARISYANKANKGKFNLIFKLQRYTANDLGHFELNNSSCSSPNFIVFSAIIESNGKQMRYSGYFRF